MRVFIILSTVYAASSYEYLLDLIFVSHQKNDLGLGVNERQKKDPKLSCCLRSRETGLDKLMLQQCAAGLSRL
jgi:hypothetical protein